MTTEQLLLFALIGVILVLLVWGRFRYDLVAFAGLVAAYLIGAVPAEEAFAGFGHPAVAIVALVLIISRGLSRSGAIELLARHLLSASRGLQAHVGVMAVAAIADAQRRSSSLERAAPIAAARLNAALNSGRRPARSQIARAAGMGGRSR